MRFRVLNGLGLSSLRQPGQQALNQRVLYRRSHMMTALIILAFGLASFRLISFVRADVENLITHWQGGFQASASEVPQQIDMQNRDRATILDANGLVLAATIDIKVLCHRPGEVSDPHATAQALKRVIPEVNVATLTQRLQSNSCS